MSILMHNENIQQKICGGLEVLTNLIDETIKFLKCLKNYKIFKPKIEKYEHYAKAQKRINGFCAFILMVFPIIISTLVLIQEHPALMHIFNRKESFLSANNLLLSVIFALSIFVIIIGVFHYWLSISNDCFIAEAMEAEKLKKEVGEYRNQIRNSQIETSKGVYTLGALDLIFCKAFHLLKTHDGNKEDEFKAFISFLVSTLYNALNRYKHSGEKFTVAIYMYDEIKDTLIDIERKKDIQIIKDKDTKQDENNADKGREWNRTDNSHVSLVFNETSGRIYGNLSESIKPRPVNSFPTDESNYVASITIPLAKNDIKKDNMIKNRGVLCITSNIEDAFYDGEEYELCSIRQRHITIIAKILEFILNGLYPKDNKQILEMFATKKQVIETEPSKD